MTIRASESAEPCSPISRAQSPRRLRRPPARPISPSAFNVTRAYINVSGQLNHFFAFRITPDIVRETAPGSSVDGSLVVRLKYGYVQMNLDDWLWRGTFVRAGTTQTPYVDFEESVYRYRFQGTVFAEREGFVTSSDSGAFVRTLVPGGYGEIIAGVFNGEGFARAGSQRSEGDRDPRHTAAVSVREPAARAASDPVPCG